MWLCQPLQHPVLSYYFYKVLFYYKSLPGCSIPTESALQMRQACFKRKLEDDVTIADYDKEDREGCETAELVEKDGFFRTTNFTFYFLS